MPYITKEQRMQGGYQPSDEDPHDGGPCDCDWSVPVDGAMLAHRVLPYPDQSRYGTATTDPLGRDGPGWHIGRNGLPVRTKGAENE